MATHPICADLGATDDRGSQGGHLWSNDVTIRFSSISRDRTEIETRKLCQTTWLVEPLQSMCILTYLGHDLTLTWPELRPNFQIDLMFRTGLTRRTRWCRFYFRIHHITKVINEKPSRWKTTIFIWWPLEPKLLTIGQIWSESVAGAWGELPNVYFRILPSYHTFGDNSDCLRKSLFPRNFTFGDLWWPQYWPDLKMTFLKVWNLVAVYLMPFTACR